MFQRIGSESPKAKRNDMNVKIKVGDEMDKKSTEAF